MILQSCNTIYYKRHAEPPPPPPPPPSCAAIPVADPSSIRGLDTTKPSAPNVLYFVFERVQGASTPLDEFGLLSIDDNDEHCLIIRGPGMKGAQYVTATKTGPSSVSSVPWEGHASQTFVSTIINRDGIPDAAIAVCTIASDEITIDTTLPAINDPLAWDGHPTVSASKRWVVFASNRQGSRNSTDIWYAKRTADGGISDARPLHGVNTYCDEISPSFAQQAGGKILFSSSGHTTFGGYDAFSADIIEDADSLIATNVVNLGPPINSAFDEIFPTMSTNGVDFYIASNRRDGRQAARRDFDVFVAFQQMSGNKPLARLTGRVVNSQTQKPVVDAEVVARSAGTQQTYASTRTDTTGSYTLSVPVSTPVQITAQTDTLFYDSYTVVVPDKQANQVVERTEPIALSRSFVLRINFPTSEYANPYGSTLDSNGIETDRAWQRELDDLAASVTSSSKKVSKILLVGHTDDVDTDESNLILGQQRVNFVIDKLVERGVSRGILEGISEGEQQLLPRRTDESIDTWRKRCRRVELKKVSS